MRKLKYIMFALSLAFIGTSCSEDFVTLTNPDKETTGQFWENEADAQAGINAVYQALYYDGMYKRLYPWVMDVRADDVINTSPWWIQAVATYTTSGDNPCYIATWEAAYKGIWRANQVLEKVPGITMDETKKKTIIAQAKFMRALYHYHVAILWKNIPLITQTPQSPDEYYPSQATPEETWAQIIKDFSEAMADLPTNDFTGKPGGYTQDDIGRATKGAAAGYLGKSYMITKQWDKAAQVLKELIDQKFGTYSLIANYRENFTKANENNSESLFEVQFDEAAGGQNMDNTWSGEPGMNDTKTSGKARTYAPLPGFGYGDVNPSNWIWEEFNLEKTKDGKDDPRMEASLFYRHVLETDPSKSDPNYKVYGKTWEQAKLTMRTDYAVKQIYNVHIRKYLNDETDNNETAWKSGINERILRYADILLLYAEAQNELGNISDAYKYIQVVRDRANLADLATTKPGMSQAQMRDQIAHERALEFCFESQRYVDILRWGWFEDPAKVEMLKAHDPEFENWVPGREIMAIRQDEIDNNKNLVQNPGW